MTSLAKFLGISGLLLTGTALGGPVPKAMVVDLERQDVIALARGLEDIFAEKPVVGRYDQPIEQAHWWGTVRAQGISYRFNLTNVRVTPEAGHFRVDVDVANLESQIEVLSFNESGSRYCQNVPLSSHGVTIPVGTKLTPWIDSTDHSFHVAAEDTTVDLSSRNFSVGRPEACHAVWGFDWLVRRLIPWTSGMVRSRLKEGIEAQIAAEAARLSKDYGRLLEVRVTLPVDAAPVPAFYADLGVWPDSLELTPDHFKFFIGAHVEFDPDPRWEADELESAPLTRLLAAGGRLPSYVGVGRHLIEHVAEEANAKGLFTFELGAADVPELGEILKAGVLALMIPDAATRFEPEAPVSLGFGGASSVDVSVDPQGGPGGIPIIDFCLTGFRVDFVVAGLPYYSMDVDTHLGVAMGYDRHTRKLKLIFQHLAVQYRQGAFSPDLTPVPADATFSVEFLDFFVKQLGEQMTAQSEDLMALILPQLRLGSHEVDLLGASYRDDYVTLDAMVR